jgi:hypothetical protein
MSAAPQGNSTPDQHVDGPLALKDAHDVNVAICNNLIHNFSQIPAHLQGSEIAEEWFSAMEFSKLKPLHECYLEVPSKFRSPDFMKAVALAGVNILGDLDPMQVDVYRDIAMTCVEVNHKNLASLDPQFRDEAAEHLSWNRTGDMHLIAREFPWIRDHMQSQEFNRCCLNIDFALDCDELPLKIRTHIFNMCEASSFKIVRGRGRLGLLAEQVSACFWPKVFDDEDMAGPRPTSIEDGINRLKQSKPDGVRETLYMAYMLAQPMDQVVPLMTGQRLQKLLFEMYPTEALQPYLKKSRALRGSFLEDSIGL